MSADDDLALAQLRESIQGKLQAQRRVLAAQLLPADTGRFPRSMTMRLLIRRPDLLGKAALGLLRFVRR